MLKADMRTVEKVAKKWYNRVKSKREGRKMLFKETEKTELKKVLNDSLQKELVAFLNSFDGMIYIGVEDDGTVVGIDNLDDTQKRIADIITTQILPNPQSFIELGTKYVDGKNVIEIKVKKAKPSIISKNTAEAPRDALFVSVRLAAV
ncbi:MAG TPA: hypothetical protein DDY77_03680 [Clostridiales bacterium]|mgnify:CR=1 FL=1|nr:hypothetical protein [Clostridiales bacterium]